jgi:hypothetical protein
VARPTQLVHAPVSGEPGAAVRLEIVGHRTFFNRYPFAHSSVYELFDEAAGGWLGEHLLIEAGGARIRVPLEGTRWRSREGFTDPRPLEPPLPAELLELVKRADVRRGPLGFVERPIVPGEPMELRAVVEARVLTPSYRVAAAPTCELVARPDLGACQLRPLDR